MASKVTSSSSSSTGNTSGNSSSTSGGSSLDKKIDQYGTNGEKTPVLLDVVMCSTVTDDG